MKTLLTTTRRADRGFSTIEILIAFAVGIVFLSAAMMVAFSGQQSLSSSSSGIYNGTFTDTGQVAALDLALDNYGLATSSNRIGKIVANLIKSWSIPSGDGDGEEIINNNLTYKNTSSIVDISPCLKQITSTTTWSSLNNRNHHITFDTALGSMDIAAAYGRGGCDPFPTGDWDNPDSAGSFDPQGINIANAGIAATAIDVKVIGGRRYAFLTSQHGSVDVPDFWIIDVTIPESPEYISSLDINNGVSWGGGHKEGANDLVVIGNYAYVLRNYKIDQLQVIDLSDLDNPSLVLPAISFAPRGVNQNGTDPQGEVIKYYDNKLYVGLHNTQGPELLVYSVATSPSVPSFVGAIANSFNHSIYDIAINGTYAYLAIKPGTGSGAQNTKELMVINISATNPTDTGNGYNAMVGSSDTAGAHSLYRIGRKLYLGREHVNSPKQDFYIFDVSNPSNPSLLASTNLNQPSNSSIEAVHVSGKLAFLGLTKSPEFQMWNISDPTDVTTFGCGDFDFPQEVTDIAYSDDYVFAAIRSNDFLRIIKDETSDTTCN